MDWLRLYHEVLDDPKVQDQSGDDFKGWINCLLIGSRNSPRGQLPPLHQLAFILRTTLQDAEAMCVRLVERGLLEWQDGRLVIHGWAQRQPRQDYSTLRVRTFRKKRRRNDETAETAETAKRRGEEKRGERGEEKGSPALAFSGVHLSVTHQQDASLAEAFPWVDLPGEYRKMDAWLEANPKKRPKSHVKFAHNWVSKISPPNGRGNGAYVHKDQVRLETNIRAGQEALRRITERDRETADRDRPGDGRDPDS